MTTTQEMIDIAMEEGASVVTLWAGYFLKVTDEGSWYLVDTADRRIDVVDARRLLDCFFVGYVD